MTASPKSTYRTYADSELSHLLATTLANIKALHAKYPTNKKSCPEAISAMKQVQTTEELISILHGSILPMLSNGNIPTIMSFLPTIPKFLTLKSLKNANHAQEKMLILAISQHLPQCIVDAKASPVPTLLDAILNNLLANKDLPFASFPKKNHAQLNKIINIFIQQLSTLHLDNLPDQKTMTISTHLVEHLKLELITPRHPMTYELVGILGALVKNVPENFADVVSFFNPLVPSTLLRNSIIAGNTKKETGIHKIKHLTGDGKETHSYSYEVTRENLMPRFTEEGVATLPNGDVYTENRHLSEEYVKERKRLLNQIVIPITRRYLAKYGAQHRNDYPHAAPLIDDGFKRLESDKARADVLEKLTNHELERLQVPHAEFTKQAQAFIASAQHTLADIKHHAIAHEDAVTLLLQKKAFYLSTPINELLKLEGNAAFLDLINQHKESALDISYAENPLPDEIQCATEGEQSVGGPVIFIRQTLLNFIDKAIQTLKDNQAFFNGKLQALKSESEHTELETLFTNVVANQNALCLTLEELDQKITVQENKVDKPYDDLPSLKEELDHNSPQMPQKIAQKQELQQQHEALLTRTNTTLSKVTANLSEQHNNAEQIEYYQRLLKALPAVITSLREDLKSTSKKPKVSFETIDTIVNPNAPSTKEHHGFFELLTLVNKKLIPEWQAYCKKQEGLFKRNPNPKYFNDMVLRLLSSLEGTTSLPTLILVHEGTRDALIDQHATLKKELNDIDAELTPIFKQKSQLENEIALFDNQSMLFDLKFAKHLSSQLFEIIADINALKIELYETLKNHDDEAKSSSIEALKVDIDALTAKFEKASLETESLKDEGIASSHQKIRLLLLPLLNILREQITKLSHEENLKQEQQRLERKNTARAEFFNKTQETLDQYVSKRTKDYYFKDFLSSSDQKARETFIASLKQQLALYNTTGNSDEVVLTIQNNLARFPGKHLKPLLYEIKADLLDEKDNVADIPLTDEITLTRHTTAITIIETFKETEPKYTQSINKLYQMLTSMKRYGAGLTRDKYSCGEHVRLLATKLSADVDTFVMSHPHKLPSQASYDAFREKFTARLHSKDNIIDTNSNFWLQLLGNIALILAVIPQLICSKIFTGHCSFFFEEPKPRRHINTIENALPLELASKTTPAA